MNTVSLRTTLIQIKVSDLNSISWQLQCYSPERWASKSLMKTMFHICPQESARLLFRILTSRGRNTSLFTQHLKSSPEHLRPSQQSLAPKRNYCIPQSCTCEDQRLIMTFSTAALIPTTRDTRGKSDENRLGVSKKPSPNKWIKRKAAPLIATSAVCLVDTGIWWVLIVAIQRWFMIHVITQVPSPGLPQEESAPSAPRRKELCCLSARKGKEMWTQEEAI